MLKVGGGLACSSSSSSRSLARAREDPPPAVAAAASGMREDPADLDQTKLAVLGERLEIEGGVMAGLDSSSSYSSSPPLLLLLGRGRLRDKRRRGV